MIDIKKYRENPEPFQEGAKKKGVEINWKEFDKLDDEVRELKTRQQDLLQERNELSSKVGELQQAGEDFQHIIDQVREIKEKVAELDDELEEKKAHYKEILMQIPNPPFDDVPVGESDEENVDLEFVGEKPEFSFTPKTHWELLEDKGYLDQERAVKLSGSRFQIIRGPLAKLQFALMQWAVEKLTKKGFEFTLVPQLTKAGALVTTGYLPNDSTNLYRVNPKAPQEQDEREEDDLWLIGTAEVSLIAQHMDEIFEADQIPKRYCGFSSCYRREAGTYGKDTKGLIRLHQFEKVEMVSFVDPKDSEKEHEMLREIEEEIYQELGIPFNRVLICSGDLGAPAAKKYDLEAWFPGMDTFKEITSTSNTTDFQTRRGNIKIQQDNNEKVYAHSLNGTAIALGRVLAAIVENYQTDGGDIRIPEVLQKWMGIERI